MPLHLHSPLLPHVSFKNAKDRTDRYNWDRKADYFIGAFFPWKDEYKYMFLKHIQKTKQIVIYIPKDKNTEHTTKKIRKALFNLEKRYVLKCIPDINNLYYIK